jgi:hypothetical protein
VFWFAGQKKPRPIRPRLFYGNILSYPKWFSAVRLHPGKSGGRISCQVNILLVGNHHDVFV